MCTTARPAKLSATSSTRLMAAMVDPFAAVATILEVPLDDPVPSHLLLKLKRKPERKRTVRFTDDTIDNEDLCRKKSKNCCVFHRSQAPPDDDDDGGDDDTPGDAHPEGGEASPAADSGSSSSSSSEAQADSAT
jgi:protein phosphatase 1 regulatory subunit 11